MGFTLRDDGQPEDTRGTFKITKGAHPLLVYYSSLLVFITFPTVHIMIGRWTRGGAVVGRTVGGL